MRTETSFKENLLHAVTAISLVLLVGCGTVVNNRLRAPVDSPFGHVQFNIDDTTKWAAHGWTVPISEMVDGKKLKYGFLGRDVLWAPLGYSKERRIPLKAGKHTLDLEVLGSEGPARLKLDVDIVTGKVIPIAITIATANPGPGFRIYADMGTATDPQVPVATGAGR